MAVQAQYPSSVFRTRNNVLQESVSRNLLAGYNNYGVAVQHIIGGAAVLSDPESELTCNNLSGSRKRNRSDQMALDHHQPQMLHQQLPPLSHPFPFPNLPKNPVMEKSTTTAPSIGLQLSYIENRLYESGGVSTSGRSASVSPLESPFTSDLNSYFLHQNLETDSLLLLHDEKLRSMLDETRKKHCRSILSVLEKKVLKRLEEKETELANASRRNAELEEKIGQLCAENQIWFNVAKNNETIVSSLKSKLERIMLQNQSQTREGFGDSEEIAVVDDAQSWCPQGNIEEDVKEDISATAEITILENRELRQRRSCKVCRENEVCVLLLPCRHLCLCKCCESKLESCPICNSVKNASLQIAL